MDLKELIKKDLIDAMKEKNKDALNTLRAVKGAVQLEVINNKKEENSDLYLDVINKQIKMRNDSITEFAKADRGDLIQSYQREIDILSKYMPKPLTNLEIEEIINNAISNIGNNVNDFGKIMKDISPRVKNRFDMSKLPQLIKNRLK